MRAKTQYAFDYLEFMLKVPDAKFSEAAPHIEVLLEYLLWLRGPRGVPGTRPKRNMDQ